MAFDLLEGGRKTHVNGIRDVGDVPVTVEYDIFDGGIVIVEDNANSQDQHAWRLRDEDNQVQYFAGTSANFTATERTASTYKGAMFQIRVQSGIVK